MNRRAKKKAEKRIRRDIHKALDIVLDINGLDKRQKELTGDLPTAYFTFWGHTASVDISIDKYGWDSDGPDSDSRSCWNSRRMGSLIEWGQKMKKELGC